MKDIVCTIIIAITLLAGVILGYLQSEKWLKQTAVQGCLEVGIDKYVNDNGLGGAEIPNYSAYSVCMKEKGYSTNIKK